MTASSGAATSTAAPSIPRHGTYTGTVDSVQRHPDDATRVVAYTICSSWESGGL
ncbi:hypothetical protein ACIBJI_10810 [Nocardia sp. NPDC050408]|uniref:hypothetical protein n=1 Tax=unclassified Nocardia TaxID=2637762 RepID=UPI0034298F19